MFDFNKGRNELRKRTRSTSQEKISFNAFLNAKKDVILKFIQQELLCKKY